jgi:hypothetical protein
MCCLPKILFTGHISSCGKENSSPQIVKKSKTNVRTKNGQQKVLLLLYAFPPLSPNAVGQLADAVGFASQFTESYQEAWKMCIL